MKKLLPILLLLLILVPILVSAQGGFIPCDKDCGYYDLLQLINNIIEWIVKVSIPVSAGVFAWAGFTYMTTGVSDQKSKAKKMIQHVFLGLVFILAAWLIVSTIMKALVTDEVLNAVPVEGIRQ